MQGRLHQELVVCQAAWAQAVACLAMPRHCPFTLLLWYGTVVPSIRNEMRRERMLVQGDWGVACKNGGRQSRGASGA